MSDSESMNDSPNESRRPFAVEVTIEAGRDDVWRAMAEVPQVRQWFGWDYEGLDAEIQFIFVDHAQFDPPDRITIDDGSAVELRDDGGRTVVTAKLAGPSDDSRVQDDGYDGIAEGWRAFLQQLRFLMEKRPGGPRRTIFLTGSATMAQMRALTMAEPSHTDRRQAAFVDNGQLVVIAGEQPWESHEEVAASVTVSTFGLDDTAFEAVRDDWAARWPTATVTTGTDKSPI